MPWFERAFEFSFAVEQYPNLCARLRGTPARLDELLRRVPREILVRQADGKWSPQEHVGHLADLESLWLARAGDFLEGRPLLTPADLSNQRTFDANHNAAPLEQILADFRRAREQLLLRVGSLDVAALGRSMLHPRLKQPMRLVDHLYFAAEHDDHHLAMIWELVSVD